MGLGGASLPVALTARLKEEGLESAMRDVRTALTSGREGQGGCPQGMLAGLAPVPENQMDVEEPWKDAELIVMHDRREVCDPEQRLFQRRRGEDEEEEEAPCSGGWAVKMGVYKGNVGGLERTDAAPRRRLDGTLDVAAVDLLRVGAAEDMAAMLRNGEASKFRPKPGEKVLQWARRPLLTGGIAEKPTAQVVMVRCPLGNIDDEGKWKASGPVLSNTKMVVWRCLKGKEGTYPIDQLSPLALAEGQTVVVAVPGEDGTVRARPGRVARDYLGALDLARARRGQDTLSVRLEGGRWCRSHSTCWRCRTTWLLRARRCALRTRSSGCSGSPSSAGWCCSRRRRL